LTPTEYTSFKPDITEANVELDVSDQTFATGQLIDWVAALRRSRSGDLFPRVIVKRGHFNSHIAPSLIGVARVLLAQQDRQ
jgi:hypothetical protein